MLVLPILVAFGVAYGMMALLGRVGLFLFLGFLILVAVVGVVATIGGAIAEARWKRRHPGQRW